MSTRPFKQILLVLSLLIVALAPLQADDRALLRDALGAPYVFILFDTSGSMHRAPQCTLENFNRPDGDPQKCNFLCPTGDCFVNRNGDDPNSKFYQAKEALYEVLKNVDDVNFGFATYNQDDLRVEDKHWLYRVADTQPSGLATLSDGTRYPFIGAEHNFGDRWSCNSGGSRHGCDDRFDFADVNDTWEMARTQRFPKLGRSGGDNEDLYIRDTNGTRYRVLFWGLDSAPTSGQELGDATLRVRIKVEECDTADELDCGDFRDNTIIYDREVVFERIGDFLAWDNDANRTEPELGFFSQSNSDDSPADNTCSGWDGNFDITPDAYSDGGGGQYSTRWSTDDTDTRGSLFSVGDVIPLDWLDNHKDELLRRFAPSHLLDPDGVQDFGAASYFNDERNSGERILKLKDERQRPILAHGSTPIGGSIRDFRTWYAGCANGNCPNGSGWKHIAEANDPDWLCRKKYLLVVTDGDNTCSGPDACSSTAALLAQEDIFTYVVAFGVENTPGNRLTCMASNGGTGDPIFPQNKQELVDALAKIFADIREEPRAFASAAVPAVQSEATDKIFLSNFTPLNGHSIWDGHLDAYLKPLPLLPDGRPNKNLKCNTSRNSACHLFDVGETILTQAPSIGEAAAGTPDALRLGMSTDRRRVLYATANPTGAVPGKLRLFSQAGDLNDQLDLWWGLGIPPANTTPGEIASTTERTRRMLVELFAKKETSVIDPNTGNPRDITFVLGDVFHSDPVIVDSPNNFSFFVQDLGADVPGAACDVNDPLTGPNRGYRCYAERHRWRRKMLLVGANDGQLHFFDAGVFHKDLALSKDPFNWSYTNGSGRELFSYMPRLTLPVLRAQLEGNRQIYTIDGSVKIDDAFLDPIHDGTPEPTEREWRSVLIGGLREAGSIDGGGFIDESAGFVSGYYALDITQPDQLDEYEFTRNTNLGLETAEQHFLPSETTVPTCLDVDTTNGEHVPQSGCKTLDGDDRPFPAELWTFIDSYRDGALELAFDEEDTNGDGTPDGNGARDLGATWSEPVLTRVRVCTLVCDPLDPFNDIEDRFVAIFGGGLDPFDKQNPQRGTWIYMIDIETGRAIYKRQVVGAVPAAPAVVSDQFGIAQRIYVGTTAGLIYKVDLSEIGQLSTETFRKELFLPQPANDIDITRVFSSAWEPFPIFDAGGRPFYQTITALRIEVLDTYGLAVGTGDREDLWALDGSEGRFYFVVDEDFTRAELLSGALPLTEFDYATLTPDSLPELDDTDFVLDPDPTQRAGWVMRLGENERTIVQTFGLKGILIFSTFIPEVTPAGGGPGNGNGGGNGGGNNNNAPLCSRTGDTRIFKLLANNANGIDAQRADTKDGFHGSPVVDTIATQNPDPNSSDPNASTLTPDDFSKIELLKKFFPKNCRFSNFWLSVTATRDDTGQVEYIKIPICSVEGRWKEN